MLRLAEQVRGHVLRVRRPVGNDQHLRGAGHHVDVQTAVGQAFGGGHIGVARPHQFVHPGDEARPVGQSGHRLGAAHCNAPVHAGDAGRRQHGGVQILGGRCHHDDLLHPRHLGGDGVHQHAAGIGGGPAWDVDAHPAQPPDDPAHPASVR